MTDLSRRDFLRYACYSAAGAASLPILSCSTTAPTLAEGRLEVPSGGYPLIEVRGRDYGEIGWNLGQAVKARVKEFLALAPDFRTCAAFAHHSRKKLERMLERTRARFPQIVEELEGMADAWEVPFLELFAYNCRSEIDVMTSTPSGCSTLGWCKDRKAVLAHNEDGGDLNVGRCYVAKIEPPSGVTFMAFVYPGLLPGNGPGFNRFGLVQTTNYIHPRRVADGVPRYIIGRAVLEAASLTAAVAIVTARGRAFSWHHNLASLPEGRLLSVETYPGRSHVQEIDGPHIHTNHLLHPEMASKNLDEMDVPYESSLTRLRVLRSVINAQGAPRTGKRMVELLSLHEGRPYSPCRHPEGKIHGVTLGTAVFEGRTPAMTLYHGNPCLGIKQTYAL